MTTLTVQEASKSLGDWMRRAIDGEQIAITEGERTVLLQPLTADVGASSANNLSPREALRLMQAEPCLTAKEAQEYLKDLAEERLAAEARRPA